MSIHHQIPSYLHSRADWIDFQLVERVMWVGTLGFWFLGDIATTIVGMELGGTESNPVTVWFLEALGYPGLFLHKLPFLAFILLTLYGLTYVGRKIDVNPTPFRATILFMFAVHGAWLVAWNSHIIYLRLTGSGYAVYPL